jgi:hypothetical protein
MKPADIRPDFLLRVINSHGLGAHVGSLATVKSIETSRSGDWVCIIEYNPALSPLSTDAMQYEVDNHSANIAQPLDRLVSETYSHSIYPY